MRESLTGTRVLTRLALRRDRVRLPVWVATLVFFTAYTIFEVQAIYPTPEERQARAAAMTSAAAVMFTGPGYGLDNYTVGAIIANESVLFVAVLAAVMSILLVTRHTRAEEESMRAELLRANPLGEHAPMAAALTAAAAANLALAGLTFAVLQATGLAVADSAALALGIASVGLVFAAVAAVAAQVTEHARAASGLAFATLGAAFVARAVGDVMRPHGSWLSWLSPIAWPQQTRAFVDLRWWPLALSALAVGAGLAAAAALHRRRDFGAGLVQPRPSRRDAAAYLASPPALLVRQQRASLLAWAVGIGLIAAVSGALTQESVQLVESNPAMAEVFAATGTDVRAAFLSLLILFYALAVGVFAVTSIARLAGEEHSGRTELALSGSVSRLSALGSAVAVAVVGSAVLLLVLGASTGLAAAATTGDGDLVARCVGAALAHLPAVMVVIGLGALLYGLDASWPVYSSALMAYALVVGMFGGLFRFPQWMLDASPFGQTPEVLVDGFSAGPLLALLAVAAALTAGGLVAFRRRDTTTA